MYNLCSESFSHFNDNPKIVVQKCCSNTLNIDPLTEKIQLKLTVIINELTLIENLYNVPGFSRYRKGFSNNFTLSLRDLASFQHFYQLLDKILSRGFSFFFFNRRFLFEFLKFNKKIC